MRLTRLDIQRLRCLRDVSFRPAPGLNLITGGNGAGKTSLIEAVHLLGYGRSFRGRVRDGLIRTGEAHLELFAEWVDGHDRTRKAGLRHAGGTWEARLDGAPAMSSWLPGSNVTTANSAHSSVRLGAGAPSSRASQVPPAWRRPALRERPWPSTHSANSDRSGCPVRISPSRTRPRNERP